MKKIKVIKLIKPFFSLENSSTECSCRKCGCFLGKRVIRLVKLSWPLFLFGNWKRSYYCTDCAVQILSEIKKLNVQDIFKIKVKLGHLYTLICDVNAENGY